MLNRQQVQTLYEQHGRVLLAYAMSLLPDRAASEDVLHQVFVKLLQGNVGINGSPIYYPNPVYPEDALAAHVEVVVILQITIGEDGSVTNALVLQSIPMLDQAAIDAALQWVFEPTLLNGTPIEVETNAHINFTLR
ncbi:MAG: hypothetical protein A3F69_03470 [Acidobacteria bacterium RIFCSPLOWO2_12_FULL_66_10]|nr:MAG: hypothetical protein A3F69_03470 [Acidobacteria bacterium RIFCSPLOWO2_12_FULL_66_10]